MNYSNKFNTGNTIKFYRQGYNNGKQYNMNNRDLFNSRDNFNRVTNNNNNNFDNGFRSMNRYNDRNVVGNRWRRGNRDIQRFMPIQAKKLEDAQESLRSDTNNQSLN